MSALDAAQSPENPFAVWTIFHGIHRWYFARGCPPTVRSDRGWVQGLRLSILLGVMGVVSGWLSTLIGRIPSPVLFTFPTLDSAPGMVSVSSFAMGATYGLLVLMPLSRWLGRPWMMAVASVPVSSATFVLAMWVALRHLQSETYDSLMVAGAVGGGVLAVWMIPSFRFRTGWLIALAALVGGGCGIAFRQLAWRAFQGGGGQFEAIFSFTCYATAYALFQSSIAIALGLPLWSPQSSDQSKTAA